MKKIWSCLLAVILCAVTASCASTFGMEEQGTDTSGISLNIGDYITLGKYYDKPILWRYVADDENGMLMLSEKLLCRRPFDVSGGFEGSSHDRRSGGSNYWGDSNIRSWLNSAAPSGEVLWLCGNPPSHDTGYIMYNGYDDEKGFLADGNFTQSERDVIKEVIQKDLLDRSDIELAVGGSGDSWGDMYSKYPGSEYIGISDFVEKQYDEICFEYVTDKVFLPDVKQFWSICQNRDVLGDDCYKATFTQEAIDNDEKDQYLISQNQESYLSTEEAWNYYLRTPFGWGRILTEGNGGQDKSGNRVLVTSSNNNFNRALAGDVYDGCGIRPAFYLDEGAAQILSGSGTEEDPYVINGKKNDNIHVYCDGWELRFDVPPVNEDGRVLVPMRKIFEALGAEVSWDENTRTATAVRGDTRITLQIDSDVMYKNDAEVQLEVPARIVGDRTLIPIRAISEALGAKVEWLEESRRINITT